MKKTKASDRLICIKELIEDIQFHRDNNKEHKSSPYCRRFHHLELTIRRDVELCNVIEYEECFDNVLIWSSLLLAGGELSPEQN